MWDETGGCGVRVFDGAGYLFALGGGGNVRLVRAVDVVRLWQGGRSLIVRHVGDVAENYFVVLSETQAPYRIGGCLASS